MNEIEQKVADLKAQMEAAVKEAAEAKAEVETLRAEMKGDTKGAEMETKYNEALAQIKLLDESIQDFNQKLNDLNKGGEVKNFEQAFKEVFSSTEFKEDLNKVINKDKSGTKVFEIKTDPTSVITSGLTGDVARTVTPSDIYSAAYEPNKFLAACSVRTIGPDKNRASWFDGTYYSNVGYVTELTAQNTGDGGALVEKYREVAKIGAFLPFSAETVSDMSYFVNWAKNEGVQSVLSKVDELIFGGDGADTEGNTKKIFGVKTQGSTAFNATTAGLALSITSANLADLIRASATQIRIQGKGRYNPNVVFLHPANVAKLYMLKNTQADYIQVLPNGAMSVYGIAIAETARIAVTEMLVADSSTLQLHQKSGLEMEVERIPSTDSFKMYLRWRGNVVVPTDAKLGNVYVANITTALAALDIATPTTTAAPTTTVAPTTTT